MAERINRRDIIVETAERLFVEQGYNATSVRQIADEVGCTEAALYYHFKDGKRALLQYVVECQMPKFQQVLEVCRDARSLPELIEIYGRTMAKVGQESMDKVRWMLAEFPNLNAEERTHIHNKFLNFHDGLAEIFARFVDDEQRADHLAWLLALAGFGYGQMFRVLDLQSVTDFSAGEFFSLISELIVNAQ
jgi:AcrR family transcriptional regulator